MEFNELKSQILEDKNIEKLVTFRYVPAIAQKAMVNNIKILCLKKENDFLSIDYLLKNLFTLLNILVNYTDIEFNDLYDENNNINLNLGLEIYDFFKENKLDQIIYDSCECNDFFIMLNNELQQALEINNSVSFILAKTLHDIANKLPSEASFKSLIGKIPTVLDSATSIKKPSKPRKTRIPKPKE